MKTKFRVWDNETKKMEFLKHRFCRFLKWGQRFIIEKTFGYKDKNGKDIYTGDIVQTNESGWVAKVIYQHSKYKEERFICIDIDDNKYGFASYCNWEKYEVIGNIHESTI